LQVHDRSKLIQTFLKYNLIDEFRLKIFPGVMSTGKKLFIEGKIHSSLNFTDSKVSTTSIIVARYIPDGEIKTSSFDLNNTKETENK